MELLLLLVSASGTPKDRKHFRAILSKLSRNILHLSFFFPNILRIKQKSYNLLHSHDNHLKDYFSVFMQKPVFILL